MPTQKITRDMVVDAAFAIAREEGVEQVLVKTIAQRLGCSVQPIYSYCESMDGLRQALVARTGEYLREYVAARIDPQDYFRSTGLAHLSFAKEEPQLYKLYFLRRRPDFHSVQDIYEKECTPQVAEYISSSLHIPLERARALHLHMVLYSVGISAILATSQSDIPIEELTAQLELAQSAFQAQAMKEENKHGK